MLDSFINFLVELKAQAMSNMLETGALVISAFSLLATIVIIRLNIKTINTAIRQIGQNQALAFYPNRKGLLEAVIANEYPAIRELRNDFELLLPASLPLYDKYLNAFDSYNTSLAKRRDFEKQIFERPNIDEDSLLLAKRIHGICTDEQIMSGKVPPLSGVWETCTDAVTGSKYELSWDKLNDAEQSAKIVMHECHDALINSIKSEIGKSIES